MAGTTTRTTSKALRDVLNALPGAVIAFKPGKDGDIPVFFNQELISKMEAADEASLMAAAKGDFWNFVHPDDRSRISRICSEVEQGSGGSASFDCRIVTAKGNLRLARVLLRARQLPEGGTLCVSFWLDLGRLPSLDSEANMDPLTGMLSMRAFFEVMEERRKVQPKGLAVLYIDVLNFRTVNLRYGLSSGDDFICVDLDGSTAKGGSGSDIVYGITTSSQLLDCGSGYDTYV
ncbi:MAG: GGDEF domain-containing protein, partial [Succinivibrio sp.]